VTASSPDASVEFTKENSGELRAVERLRHLGQRGAKSGISIMTYHRFKVDQRVIYKPERDMMGDAGAAYVVVRLLPPAGREPQYRIRLAADGQERVATENELQDGT
jgi:hypothetical protein